MSFFQILTLFNPQKDIKMQVGLQSGLLREVTPKKKCSPPLLLFFMFLKFHLKSTDLSLFLEGGGWYGMVWFYGLDSRPVCLPVE